LTVGAGPNSNDFLGIMTRFINSCLLLCFLINCSAQNLTDLENDLATCVADSTSTALLDLLWAIETKDISEYGTWLIPVDALEDDSVNNARYPILGKESFEWFSNVLPNVYDRDNKRNFKGLPPPPISLFPPRTQMFPFWNYQRNTESWGHKKFAAFPRWIVAVLGNDPYTYKSESLRNSIFAKNLEDRGEDNLLKKQYMSALTCDKLPLYLPKLEAAVNRFVQDITVDGKPVMSSFYQRNLELFLDLHLEGPTGHPDYVLEYAELFTQILSPGEDYASLILRRNETLRASCLYPYVEAYFEERRQFVVDNEVKSTLMYWWDKAGIPRESVVFEAAHNLLAWGQFGVTLFNLIRAKLQGYISIDNLLDDPVLDRPIDFFAKMKQATTDNEKLDVAREVYRMLVPTQFILSQLETQEANTNEGKPLGDDDFDGTSSLLLPLFLQIINDGFDPLRLTSEFGVYNTSRFQDFQPPAGGCPFASGEYLDDDLEAAFGVSDVDGETVVPVSHSEYFAVFPAGERRGLLQKINGPKYCPFGLGYRRCPAELLNFVYVQILLDKMSELEFRVEGDDDLYDEPEWGADDFYDAIPFALNRIRDNLFVV